MPLSQIIYAVAGAELLIPASCLLSAGLEITDPAPLFTVTELQISACRLQGLRSLIRPAVYGIGTADFTLLCRWEYNPWFCRHF